MPVNRPRIAHSKRRVTGKRKFSKRKFTSPRVESTLIRPTATLKGGVNSPFPSALFTKLTYNDELSLSSTAGGLAENLFRLNSLYDPDQTGSGAQPRYFDTLCGPNSGTAPYYNYRVHAAKVTVDFQSTSITPNSLGQIWINAYTVSPPQTPQDARESPRTKVATIVNLASGSGQSHKKLSFFVKMKDILGHTDLRDVKTAGAAYNANPTDVANLQVAFMDSLGNSTNCTASVKIVYFCEFFALNAVSSS